MLNSYTSDQAKERILLSFLEADPPSVFPMNQEKIGAKKGGLRNSGRYNLTFPSPGVACADVDHVARL